MQHKRFLVAQNPVTRRKDAARRRELSKEWTFRDGLILDIAWRGGIGGAAIAPPKKNIKIPQSPVGPGDTSRTVQGWTFRDV